METPQNNGPMTIQDAAQIASGYSSYKDAFFALCQQHGKDSMSILSQAMSRK